MATHKALVLRQYGKAPVLEEIPIPVPKPGQLLIKLEASTINPSDRIGIEQGVYLAKLPTIAGMEGTGRVVEANGQNIQHWVGKRVSFLMPENVGIWGDFSIAKPDTTFQIDEDVDLTTAASGIVNPLTVIGIITNYNKVPGKKGIIHTAAASSLGRMLNRYCQSHGIPLLNIVRKDQQAELLKSEGAQHVLVTKGDWENSYREIVKAHGFNVFFDALGGGQVLQKLITGLRANSWVFIYGSLEQKPLTIKKSLILGKGVFLTGFILLNWWATLSEEQKSNIKTGYSQLLKGDLKTKLYKILTFAQIEEALKLSVQKTLQGKITLVPK